MKTDKHQTTNLLKVEGMTCNHCKAAVEKTVGKIEGIDNVTATPANNSVEISGQGYDIVLVKEAIKKLGYTVKD